VKRPELRSWLGVAIGLLGVSAVTILLVPVRTDVNRSTPALALVLPVVAAGVVGRRLAAVVTGLAAGGLLSYYFEVPYNHLSVSDFSDVVALTVFLLVALVVGTLVAIEANRRQAAEDRAEEIRRLYEHNAELVAERERLREEADRVALMERLDEQRKALLRSVSHDLRTPLSTIQAVASDLRSGTAYPPETRDRLLDLVGREAERLNRIVENLLSMSRIETGALQPDRQAVAIDELVADRVQKMQRLFEGVAVTVDLGPATPLVDADYSQLDQVISNLLENAARHSPPGSTVCIGAEPLGCMMKVTITDEGAGIPDHDIEHIFEPFRRGEGSLSSGVGLAICKAMIEANGGSIGVDVHEGTGCRFHFTVPLYAEADLHA
jgi:K+-sensing histidine kinase KdpD